MNNINFKLIYKIASVIAMIFFFVPTFVVRCGAQEMNISAVHAVIGYPDDIGGWYSEPQIGLMALIIVPVAIFIFSMRKEAKNSDTVTLIAILSAIYTVAWPVMHFLIQNHMDNSDIPLPYSTKPAYYLAILDGGIVFALSMYERYLINNHQEFGEDKVSKYVSNVIENISEGNISEKERLWMCGNCYKVFAISNKHSNPNCPKCGDNLLSMDISLTKWERMSDDEKKRYKKYILNDGIREI